MAKSLLSERILANLVPRATSKAYWVTGTVVYFNNFGVIPKESRSSIVWHFWKHYLDLRSTLIIIKDRNRRILPDRLLLFKPRGLLTSGLKTGGIFKIVVDSFFSISKDCCFGRFLAASFGIILPLFLGNF